VKVNVYGADVVTLRIENPTGGIFAPIRDNAKRAVVAPHRDTAWPADKLWAAFVVTVYVFPLTAIVLTVIWATDGPVI